MCQALERLLGEWSISAETSLTEYGGLWEQGPISKVETVFVEDCNRASKWGSGHCAVVFEALDQGDEVTLQSLAEAAVGKISPPDEPRRVPVNG